MFTTRYNLAGGFKPSCSSTCLRFAGSRASRTIRNNAWSAEIRKLQGQIPGLVETFVGINISPRGQGYELGGVMKFADQSALDNYGAHPVHQKLLSWLMPLIDPIEVDFDDRI